MKLLVADDHHLIREGLKHTLEGVYHNAVVVEATDGKEVLETLESNPDTELMLLDFFMPGTNGFDLVSKLCEEYPHIPVVIISASDDPLLMRKMLDRGAVGYVPKATDHEEVKRALQLVRSGGVYVPPHLAEANKQPAGESHVEVKNHNGVSIPSPARKEQVLTNLTKRQIEVLQLIAQGKTNKDISRLLQVSENTVKVHVTAILKALGVTNRTQAVIVAQRLGVR